MKIKRVELENFRSIRQMGLDFRPGFNIIAGVNGAGKSTLLDAIDLLLSWVKNRIRLHSSSGSYPQLSDISKGATFARLRIVAENSCGTDNDKEIIWEIAKISSAFRNGNRPKSELGSLTEFTDQLASLYYENNGEVSMPMFVKYSVNRSLIDIPTHVHKKHVLDAMALYEGKIDGGSNLRSFYEWFREREDIEREEREERKTFEYEDKQLKSVRTAISLVMEGYGDLHTRRKAPSGFELRKDGKTFRVEELSDGEKCYLTLIGDIARRLAICNPALQNPTEGEGIILIDELELHLHPLWQAQAIDKLRKVFPNCQFFITTHSPHIVQNLHLETSDSITVLRDGNYMNVETSYGSPVDEVLSEVFQLETLRPLPLQIGLKNIWALLNEGDFDSPELENALNDLKLMLPNSDPEMSRINLQVALNKKRQAK